MPRACVQAVTKSAAIAERVADWISGGMSWIASLMATLLKPQLTQSPTVTAMASASRGREEGALVGTWTVMWSALRDSALPAMRADADDLDQRTFGRKSGGARRRLERFRNRAARPLPDCAAAFADEKHNEIVAAVIVHARHERIAALDAVHEAVVAKKIECPIDRDRR